MIATTVNPVNTPLIYYEENKSEIRSINEVFPEYTSYSVNDYKDNVKDVLYNLYSNVFKNIRPYSTDINILSGIAMSKYYKRISEVKVQDHLYKFESNFIYSITKEEECIVAENEFFNIFGYGDTIEEAEKELYSYINDLWECYVEDNDENLDESAIILKEKLLTNIRKVY